MRTLTLLIDGEEKTFTIPFVSGLVWRKWIELQAKAEDLQNLTLNELDEFASLVVMAFKNQFTLEQFYDGIPFEKVMSTIEELFLPPADDANEGKKK
jgi:hypothetical protein